MSKIPVIAGYLVKQQQLIGLINESVNSVVSDLQTELRKSNKSFSIEKDGTLRVPDYGININTKHITFTLYEVEKIVKNKEYTKELVKSTIEEILFNKLGI